MFVSETEKIVYEIIENVFDHCRDDEPGKNYFSPGCDQWKSKR